MVLLAGRESMRRGRLAPVRIDELAADAPGFDGHSLYCRLSRQPWANPAYQLRIPQTLIAFSTKAGIPICLRIFVDIHVGVDRRHPATTSAEATPAASPSAIIVRDSRHEEAAMCEKDAPRDAAIRLSYFCGQQTAVGDAVGLFQVFEPAASEIAFAVGIQCMVGESDDLLTAAAGTGGRRARPARAARSGPPGGAIRGCPPRGNMLLKR